MCGKLQRMLILALCERGGETLGKCVLKMSLGANLGKTNAHYASGSGSGSAYQHVGLSPTGRRTLILKHTTDGCGAPPQLHPTVPILTSLLSVAGHSKVSLLPQCSYSLRATGEGQRAKYLLRCPAGHVCMWHSQVELEQCNKACPLANLSASLPTVCAR